MKQVPDGDGLRAMTKKQLRRYVRNLETALKHESRRADNQAERANGLRRQLRQSVARNYQLREALLKARQAANVIRQAVDLASTGPLPDVDVAPELARKVR